MERDKIVQPRSSGETVTGPPCSTEFIIIRLQTHLTRGSRATCCPRRHL